MNASEQSRRAIAFRALHEQPAVFVVANPWDAGSARLLTQLGFAALATTSAGLAHSLGRPDGARLVSRTETLAHARAMVAATHLPVAADLEDGFADDPDEVARTILLAAQAGLVGGSIEDTTGRPEDPILPFEAAVERVAAAASAARTLGFPFTLTARADNFLYGRPDLRDTIRRLQAFQAAGADVLFAPGLPDTEAIREVCSSVHLPVNVLPGGGLQATVAELGALGVRRVSMGSALSRTALAAMLDGAREVLAHGTFSFASQALPYTQVNGVMAQEPLRTADRPPTLPAASRQQRPEPSGRITGTRAAGAAPRA